MHVKLLEKEDSMGSVSHFFFLKLASSKKERDLSDHIQIFSSPLPFFPTHKTYMTGLKLIWPQESKNLGLDFGC